MKRSWKQLTVSQKYEVVAEQPVRCQLFFSTLVLIHVDVCGVDEWWLWWIPFQNFFDYFQKLKT
jgi:hypothetical protein